LSLAGKKTLYICYFWIREPLVQTQVIPYLRELTKAGVEVTLLTFEAAGDRFTGAEAETERQRLAAIGIEWQSLTYHKRPSVPATFYDIVVGAIRVRRLINERKLDVIHCRVHVPTVMGALGRMLSRRRPKLLFDIRGFFPEEYTDAGVWKADGFLFKTAKLIERWLLRTSDGFVVLTERARDILFPESRHSGLDGLERPVEVIPCCVDISRFAGRDDEASKIRASLRTGDRRMIVYVGALGGWYLTDDMVRLFAEARAVDPGIFVTILTKKDQEAVRELLRGAGFSDGDFYVSAVPPSELPAYLEASDIGVSLIKACYSKQSSSPTKIAEYLAAGVTVISNKGVGDVDATLAQDGIGVLLEDLTPVAMRKGVERALEMAGQRQIRRELAASSFDLENVGGERYRRLYARLLGE